MKQEAKDVAGLLYRVKEQGREDVLELRIANFGNIDIFPPEEGKKNYEQIGRAVRRGVAGGAETVFSDFHHVFPGDRNVQGAEEEYCHIIYGSSLEPMVVQAFTQYFGQDIFNPRKD